MYKSVEILKITINKIPCKCGCDIFIKKDCFLPQLGQSYCLNYGHRKILHGRGNDY